MDAESFLFQLKRQFKMGGISTGLPAKTAANLSLFVMALT